MKKKKIIKRIILNFDKLMLVLFLFPFIGGIIGFTMMNIGDLPHIKEVKILEIKEDKIIVKFDETFGDIETRELKKPIFFKKKVGDYIYVKYNSKNPNITMSIRPDIFEIIGKAIMIIGFLPMILISISIFAIFIIICIKVFMIKPIYNNIKKLKH